MLTLFCGGVTESVQVLFQAAVGLHQHATAPGRVDRSRAERPDGHRVDYL